MTFHFAVDEYLHRVVVQSSFLIFICLFLYCFPNAEKKVANNVYKHQIDLQQSLDIRCQYNRNQPDNDNCPK